MLLTKEVESYLYYCKFQKELDDKTIKAYRIDLMQFSNFIGEEKSEINKDIISSYLFHLHKKYKQKTTKRKIASTKAFFHYLEEEGIIEKNPFYKVKTKFKEEVVLPKIIPRDVIEKLLNYLYSEEKSEKRTRWQRKLILRDIAVIEMLFSTGIRISELCNLQNKLFDSKTGVFCIQGKGGRERYLQIANGEVLEVVNTYKDSFQYAIDKHGYFFVNRYGNPLSDQAARRMIHKYANAIQANFNITPHMFRHSFATFLMEEEVNIRYIQKMLGHTSITTTQIYTYVTTEKEKEILKSKHPRNKMKIDECHH